MTTRPDQAPSVGIPGVPRGSDRPLTDEEAREFSRVLGIDTISRPAGESAISGYADNYDDLVADPLKSLLSTGPRYFDEIKVDVTLEMTRRYFGNTPFSKLRAVDVGCGSGKMMRHLDKYFCDVWGCDPSNTMISRAGGNALQMTSPLELPFDPDSFDIAICACVYHHIDPTLRQAHLNEIKRCTKMPGF